MKSNELIYQPKLDVNDCPVGLVEGSLKMTLNKNNRIAALQFEVHQTEENVNFLLDIYNKAKNKVVVTFGENLRFKMTKAIVKNKPELSNHVDKPILCILSED